MATNKFATILHKNSNKITVILVYAFLEWVLIALLLLNSLFGYLISKFAVYFGLKPPCPLCSNVQQLLLQQHKGGSGSGCSFGDQVCEEHADEISRLSYCSNHRRLAETRGLCSYCLTTPGFGDNPVGSARIAFVTFASQKEYQGRDEVSSCSCCGESSKGEHVGPFLLLKPSWNNLAIEELDDDDDDIRGEFKELKKPNGLTNRLTETCQEIEDPAEEGIADEHQVLSDIESFGIREASEEDCSNSKSVSSSVWYEKEETHMNDKEAGSDCADKISCGSSNRSQILDGVLLKCSHVDDGLLDIIDFGSKQDELPEDLRVIPVEMIDASTNENTKLHILVEEHLRRCHHPDEDFSLNSMIEAEISLLEETFIVDESVRKTAYDEMRNLNADTFRPRRFQVLNSEVGTVQLFGMSCQRSETIRGDRSLFPIHEDFVVTTMEDANKLTALEDHTHIHGTMRDLVPGKFDTSVSALREANTSIEENGDEAEKPLQRFASVEENCHTYIGNESEPEGEEEDFSETPTSVSSLDYMHKKSRCDKLESSLEESLEESVKSHMGGCKNVMTIDQLSAALEMERKALHALCAELEEERNASAVATSQTMAMITRLQEEKAAMQMEALQYQRMMEEQSEYDQEALQLLNELMVKREKEKQELEKELEVCRKKVLDYEYKERIRVARKFNAEGSSGLELSASENAEEEHDMVENLDNGLRDDECATPTNEVFDLEEMALDCVKHISSLDDSLSEFEEERLSILDQLRALEEKLLTMSNGEEPHDKGRVNEQYSTCDGRESDEGRDNGVVLDASNEESNSNLLPEYKTTCSPTARRLLPLLDAAENEANGREVLREHPGPVFSKLELSGSGSISEEGGQNVAIEEVDRVYERLQALEADREFLKHCVNSFKQGDKGMSLLQEILQHLRDLKDVELRA